MFNLSYILQQNDLVNSKLAERAYSQIDSIVETLRNLLQPSKIIIFGSINEGGRFHRHSDIDIAVSNIDEDKYLQAYGEILTKSYFPIDLIIMEKARKSLKEKIIKTGRVVYERKKLKIKTLISEIKDEILHLKSILSENEKVVEKINKGEEFDFLMTRGQGCVIHDFYCGIERIFEKIAYDLNGGVPGDPSWHQRLLYEMSLEIKDVRPEIISKDTYNNTTVR